MKGSYYRTKNSCKVIMLMMESKLSLLPRRCRHREVVRGVWVVVGGIGLYRGWFWYKSEGIGRRLGVFGWLWAELFFIVGVFGWDTGGGVAAV